MCSWECGFYIENTGVQAQGTARDPEVSLECCQRLRCMGSDMWSRCVDHGVRMHLLSHADGAARDPKAALECCNRMRAVRGAVLVTILVKAYFYASFTGVRRGARI